MQSFSRQIQGAYVALFYYSGHGVQVRGENYLVPITANPVREADVDFQLMDANLVLRQMEHAGTKLNVVILDACRNNPFGGRGFRAISRGLARMQASEGTLISYATQPGNVALDGNDGNSPYTKALAQTIRRPGLDIFQTFNEVGLAVMQATGNSQQPWLASSPIKGNFYFAGGTQTPSSTDLNSVTPTSTVVNGFDGAWIVSRQGINCLVPSYQFVITIKKATISGNAGGGQISGAVTNDGTMLFSHPSSPGSGVHNYSGVLTRETGSGKFNPNAQKGKCTGTFIAKRN